MSFEWHGRPSRRLSRLPSHQTPIPHHTLPPPQPPPNPRAIFTPLLDAIDQGEIDPETYEYGSRGPASLDAFLASTGYVRSSGYTWRPRTLEVG